MWDKICYHKNIQRVCERSKSMSLVIGIKHSDK